MKNIKVVFSITKLGKENTKQTGRGFINKDNVLLLKLKRKDGTTKWKGIDDYNKYLFPTIGKTDEYKGYYTEYHEDTEIPRDDGSYDIRDTETTFYIWFKKIA